MVPAVHAQVSEVGARSQDNPAEPPAGREPLLTYGVAVGAGESDNVSLVSTDRISQTVAAADADFALKDQSRLINVDAVGKFSYLDYLQHAYAGQLTGRFDGSAQVIIVPQRVSWVVRDNFGQTAIDPYSPVTPTNLEDINYFSTGPDFSLRLGGLNFLNLSARYARTQYQSSPYDSNRGLGGLSVGREISAAASVSIDADFERAMFTNAMVNTDFDRTALFGRYELKAARTELEFDVGGSKIAQQVGSTTGPLVRLRLSRALSASAKLILTAGREPTDAASSFSTPQNGSLAAANSGTVPGATSSSSYTKDHASVGWQFVRNRTTLSLLTEWEKDSYRDQPELNVNRAGLDFILERRLTHALTAQFRGAVHKTDYPETSIATDTASSNYADGRIGSALIFRPGRILEIRLCYDHTVRSVAAGASGYSDNRVFFTVGYRPEPAAGD